MLLADVHASLFKFLCELFSELFCTDFMKPKFVVHHFIGRIMSNLQNMYHFINSHSSNRTMSRADSMLSSVMAVDGRPAPLPCVTFVLIFF